MAADMTPGAAEALKEAVAAIYFADDSDYLSALWSVVRSLSPEIAELLEREPSNAYHTADDMAAEAKRRTVGVVRLDEPKENDRG